MRTTPAYLLLLSCCFCAGAAVADDPDGDFVPVYHPEMETRRAAGSITIDGKLDDPGWVGIPVADNFAEHNPGDQVRPPVDTRAMITYDDDNLYLAYVCDDDPAAVRASFTERDHIWRDDYVITCLDTYADQSWAYEIACNPYGIQGDLLWSANFGEDMNYEMVYRSAGRITDTGWQVELAIPWSSLRFPDRDEQTWRVDFWRNRPREVRGQYSWAAYDRNDSCWPCEWGTVRGIRDVRPGRGIELLPAQVVTQSGGRSDDGVFHNGKLRGETSLSAKATLSSSFTVESTVNPDFSQVESDAAQIDVNSTVALRYPEHRPFFQEGSDMYTTYFNAVYTRTINDPIFAAKVTGRPGRTSVAYLVSRDETSPYILPFEESSEELVDGHSTSNILRVRHSLGDGSEVGFLGTDRRIDGGGSGTVAGVDGRVRLNRRWQVKWQALGSRTEEPVDEALTADLRVKTFSRGSHTSAFDGEKYDGFATYGSLEYNDRNSGANFAYWATSPTFRADNGYIERNDRREADVSLAHVFRRDAPSLLESVQPQLNLGRVWNFADARKDEWAWLGVSTRLRWAQAWFQISRMESNERFHDIRFGNIEATEFDAQIMPSDLVQGGFTASRGRRIARYQLVMGHETNLSAWVDLKPIDRIRVETTWGWVESRDVRNDATLFRGYILRSRIGIQATRELSMRLVLQYDDFESLWEADPLVTYRINPFSIFYVGSTRDYGYMYPEQHGVQGWRLADRQYFMKLQYLFQI